MTLSDERLVRERGPRVRLTRADVAGLMEEQRVTGRYQKALGALRNRTGRRFALPTVGNRLVALGLASALRPEGIRPIPRKGKQSTIETLGRASRHGFTDPELPELVEGEEPETKDVTVRGTGRMALWTTTPTEPERKAEEREKSAARTARKARAARRSTFLGHDAGSLLYPGPMVSILLPDGTRKRTPLRKPERETKRDTKPAVSRETYGIIHETRDVHTTRDRLPHESDDTHVVLKDAAGRVTAVIRRTPKAFDPWAHEKRSTDERANEK